MILVVFSFTNKTPCCGEASASPQVLWTIFDLPRKYILLLQRLLENFNLAEVSQTITSILLHQSLSFKPCRDLKLVVLSGYTENSRAFQNTLIQVAVFVNLNTARNLFFILAAFPLVELEAF